MTSHPPPTIIATQNVTPRSQRLEEVSSPREDQGICDALGRAFGQRVEQLPREMTLLVERLR